MAPSNFDLVPFGTSCTKQYSFWVMGVNLFPDMSRKPGATKVKGTFLEVPRVSYRGSNVEEARHFALSVLSRSVLPGEWVLVLGKPSLIARAGRRHRDLPTSHALDVFVG